ncbi:hypothetical protein FZ934_08270 [Rhizobium grahamii]|uniref:TnsA endonuclease N-terminal domain-containing protein n=1 Tax=Rhizobium grahamii TaxID=1120045 RepID=A0A5Q0C3F5_9HYPH|nr:MULTISPECIES: hypothetical protein [Rhizobium]QFY60428.1 hypothetical protein FZ934_08270 [Rhizobium grahamii]QRM50444.1 hypothetical protein F3Y33_14620 [Rhizobium sp. BG6]
MDTRLERVKIDLGEGCCMYRARDGGPIRFGANGRKRNATHIYNSAKVVNHILPAESDAEFQVMQLLDLSTSALTYMAQPHTLVFPRIGRRGKWRYTSDLEVIVPRWFVRQLEDGVPFAIAALKMPQRRAAADDLVRLVLEVKGASKYLDLGRLGDGPEDIARAQKRAAEKKDYEAKLQRANEIYRAHGYYFHIVEEMRDLRPFDLRHLPSILMDDTARVPRRLSELAWRYLRRCDGVTTYAEMIEVLGGGPTGREAANCLHAKGHIWIDLSQNPRPFTKVAMPPLLGSRQSLLAMMAHEEA